MQTAKKVHYCMKIDCQKSIFSKPSFLSVCDQHTVRFLEMFSETYPLEIRDVEAVQ